MLCIGVRNTVVWMREVWRGFVIWTVLLGERDTVPTPCAQPWASSTVPLELFPFIAVLSSPQTSSYLLLCPTHPCSQQEMFAVHLPPVRFSSNCLTGPLFSSLIEWFLSLPSSFFLKRCQWNQHFKKKKNRWTAAPWAEVPELLFLAGSPVAQSHRRSWEVTHRIPGVGTGC